MNDLFDQITGTLEAGFPYAAITMAVSIPDVCAHLRLPPEAREKSGQKARYIGWYNECVAADLRPLTGDDCYSIRCGVVHMGRFGNSQQRFNKVIFLGESSNEFGFGTIDTELIFIETRNFCHKMITGAQKWLNNSADNAHVNRNLSRLVRYRPNGIKGLIQGIPVIA